MREAMLMAIAKNPGDWAPSLIYSDWLLERDLDEESLRVKQNICACGDNAMFPWAWAGEGYSLPVCMWCGAQNAEAGGNCSSFCECGLTAWIDLPCEYCGDIGVMIRRSLPVISQFHWGAYTPLFHPCDSCGRTFGCHCEIPF